MFSTKNFIEVDCVATLMELHEELDDLLPPFGQMTTLFERDAPTTDYLHQRLAPKAKSCYNNNKSQELRNIE